MKKSQFLMIIFVFFLLLLLFCKTVAGLEVAWNPNTEPDVSQYNLYSHYRGNYQKVNDDPIMHPTTSQRFGFDLLDESY